MAVTASGVAFAAEQSRTVGSFTSIRSQGAMLVNVEVGAAQSLVLKGNDKFLEKLSPKWWAMSCIFPTKMRLE